MFLLSATVFTLALMPAWAQLGSRGGAQGPNLGGAMDKLFGANQSFSAMMEFQTTRGEGTTLTMPGKMNFDSGRSRFEMNMSEVQGSQMPAGAANQLKSLGMDTVISISRPDLKTGYLIYPGLNSYTEIATHNAATNSSPDDYKAAVTELGKETVDGHDCVKNKVTVTDKDGNAHEYMVWDATDLKNFPIKVTTTEAGSSVTMMFKDISLTKPAANLFDPPSGYTKYADAQTMMQTEMMKRMGGGMGMPPAQK